MTYCVGVRLQRGLIFLADSRTNAGVDHINRFRKMTVWEAAGERVMVLLVAGNLAVTQAAVNFLQEDIQKNDGAHLLNAPTLFAAASLIGDAIRRVHARDAEALKNCGIEFTASMIFGGQIRGEAPRMFNIYTAGNFIEASAETPYFQIGEAKYGKPILDRVLKPSTSLEEAAKCVLVSMDSTVRSNLSVGPPFDLLAYAADSLHVGCHVSLDGEDPYFAMIHNQWGEELRKVFMALPNPGWPGLG